MGRVEKIGKSLIDRGFCGSLLLVASCCFVVVCGFPGSALGRDHRAFEATPAAVDAHSLPTVALSALPASAQSCDRLIYAGGPFPYAKDGSVFANRERSLPAASRGYYREYTVKTPRARDRAARRIVCGGSVPTRPDACYYTADHYRSFNRITQ